MEGFQKRVEFETTTIVETEGLRFELRACVAQTR